MDKDIIELESYRLIRIKASDLLNPCANEELGWYTKGIVDLQTELYKDINNEQYAMSKRLRKIEIETINELYDYLLSLNNSSDDKIMREINTFRENLK